MDGKLRLWNYERTSIAKSYSGHSCKQFCSPPAFCGPTGQQPGGKQPWVVSGSEDGGIYVWGLNSKKVRG